MKNFPFLIAALGFICGVSLKGEDKPLNVLFIAVDDMNDWVTPFGGHPLAKTPHLERFAEEGAVVFQNTHCPGPVCGPSRSAILSGFMPNTTGVYGNSTNMLGSEYVQKFATLPEYFSRNGYWTLSRGKISHAHYTENGSDRGQWMYDYWERTSGTNQLLKESVTSRDENLIRGQPGPPSNHTRGSGSPFAWGVMGAATEETTDYETAKWAAEQLQASHDQPFFMAVGLSKPHLPFYSPQEFWDLYPEDGDYAPEIREDDFEDILNAKGEPVRDPTPDYLWLKENDLINECARSYLACLSYADHCLGVIFEGLRNSPHRDNTVVIFWGDHGWHLGEKLRYRKGYLWSESTRTPMMVRLPGMTERQDCERPVNLIDFYRTLIELCGLPEKPELDGRSFVPLLNDPSLAWEPTVTIGGKGSASVHDERWNYIRRTDGSEELYDLDSDPMEWTNQASNPEHEAVKAHLSKYYPNSFADSPPTLSSEKKDALKKIRGIDESIRPMRVKLQLK
ncbi:MAG: sulfatase [Verrucomicrobiota bacterium]